MVRAGRIVEKERWLRVERPVMPWPQWLDGVRFRGRMSHRRFGHIATYGVVEEDGRDFALVADEEGTVRAGVATASPLKALCSTSTSRALDAQLRTRDAGRVLCGPKASKAPSSGA